MRRHSAPLSRPTRIRSSRPALGSCTTRKTRRTRLQDALSSLQESTPFREESELPPGSIGLRSRNPWNLLAEKETEETSSDAIRGSKVPPLTWNSLLRPTPTAPNRLLKIWREHGSSRRRSMTLPKPEGCLHPLAVEGLGNTAIADILETTVTAADSLIHRATKNLRKKLSRHYAKAFRSEG